MAGLIQSGLSAILPRDHRLTVTLVIAGAGALALLHEYYTRRNGDVAQRHDLNSDVSIKIKEGNEKLEEAIQSYEQALAEMQSSNDVSSRMQVRAMLLRAYEIQAILSPDEFNMRSSMMIEGGSYSVRDRSSEMLHVVRGDQLELDAAVPVSVRSHHRTISDVSDLSDYMEAFEDLLSEDDTPTAGLYETTLALHTTAQFTVRNDRTVLANVANTLEYTVKVQCVRQAFDHILLDVTKQQWLKTTGKNNTSRLLELAGADTALFSEAFDSMLDYSLEPANLASIMNELKGRRVPCLNVFDIVIDFCLLDSFDDLDKPPAAITSIIGNSWISQGIRKGMLSTAVSSMISSKKSKAAPGGFLTHFYDIMGVLAPALAWGFLGDDPVLHPLCVMFRNQCNNLIRQVFDHSFVNYSSVESLAHDVYRLMIQAADEFKAELDDVS